MTPDEIRKLLNEATVTPWEVDTHRVPSQTGWDVVARNAPDLGMTSYVAHIYSTLGERGLRNAQLIAAAINALPALLDAAEALEEGERLYAEAQHDDFLNPGGPLSRYMDWERRKLGGEKGGNR